MLSGSLLMDERREDESKKVSKTASFPDFGLYVPLSSFFAVSFDSFSFSFRGRFRGMVAWILDGSSGSCAYPNIGIDLLVLLPVLRERTGDPDPERGFAGQPFGDPLPGSGDLFVRKAVVFAAL